MINNRIRSLAKSYIILKSFEIIYTQNSVKYIREQLELEEKLIKIYVVNKISNKVESLKKDEIIDFGEVGWIKNGFEERPWIEAQRYLVKQKYPRNYEVFLDLDDYDEMGVGTRNLIDDFLNCGEPLKSDEMIVL